MQVEVIMRGGPLSALPVSSQVKVSGLDKIDPAIPISNVTLGAFATAADRIEIVGESDVGAFTRLSDVVRVEVVNSRLMSTRRIIYEFSGWQKR